MKTLVVEDDYVSQLVLREMLSRYGEVSVANNGQLALAAFRQALDENKPFELICLDIMMPELDGQTTLIALRKMEEAYDIREPCKIIMTTALGDNSNILQSFREQCDAYVIKPVTRDKLVEQLQALELIPA